MINPKTFPVVMIVECVLAAISYAAAGDIRKTLYWLFAAGITATVTF